MKSKKTDSKDIFHVKILNHFCTMINSVYITDESGELIDLTKRKVKPKPDLGKPNIKLAKELILEQRRKLKQKSR